MRMRCEDMGWWRNESKETTEAKSKGSAKSQGAWQVPHVPGFGRPVKLVWVFTACLLKCLGHF